MRSKNGKHDPKAQSIHGDLIAVNRIRRLFSEVLERRLTQHRLTGGGNGNGQVTNTPPFTARASWIDDAGGEDSLDPRRSIFDECGYPSTRSMTPQRWQALHDRDAVAATVNEAMVRYAWQVKPDVFEKEQGKVKTNFDRAWMELGSMLRSSGVPDVFDNEGGGPVEEVWERANALSGVGRFGLIVYGLNDGLRWDEPVAGIVESGSQPGEAKIDEKTGKPALDAQGQPVVNIANRTSTPPRYELTRNQALTEGRKLGYLNAFSEALVRPARFETNKDSPRFGRPTAYQVTFQDPKTPMWGIGMPMSTENVHWTRCQHVADWSDTYGNNNVFCVPRCQTVLNNVLAASKVLHGAAEGYWKHCFPYLFLTTHPQLGGDVDVDDEELRDMIEAMMNGLQKAGVMTGMEPRTVGGQVVDPTPHVNVHLEIIAMKKRMPTRIFKGGERGTGLGNPAPQDDDAWDDQVVRYQGGYVTSGIVRPSVSQLVWYGILPPPEGSNRIKAKWPDVTSMSADAKAKVLQSKMAALGAYMLGGQNAMTLFDFYVNEFGYDEEQAKRVVDHAMLAAGETNGVGWGIQDDQTPDELGTGVTVSPEEEDWTPPGQPQPAGQPGTAEQPATATATANAWSDAARAAALEARKAHVITDAPGGGAHLNFPSGGKAWYPSKATAEKARARHIRELLTGDPKLFYNVDAEFSREHRTKQKIKAGPLDDDDEDDGDGDLGGEAVGNVKMCWGRPCPTDQGPPPDFGAHADEAAKMTPGVLRKTYAKVSKAQSEALDEEWAKQGSHVGAGDLVEAAGPHSKLGQLSTQRSALKYQAERSGIFLNQATDNDRLCWGHECANPQQPGEHGASGELEHVGHEAHLGHSGAELLEHGAWKELAAAQAASVAGRALRQIAKVPGLKVAAGELADLHDAMSAKAEAALGKLKERYGAATTSAIVGASIAAIPGGGVAAALPGGKLLAALPGLALAEVGHKLGFVGPGTKLEAGLAKVSGVVHGVRAAIGRGVEKVRAGAEGAFRSALAGNVEGVTVNVELTPEQIKELGTQLAQELATGTDGADLSDLDQFLDEGEPDQTGNTWSDESRAAALEARQRLAEMHAGHPQDWAEGHAGIDAHAAKLRGAPRELVAGIMPGRDTAKGVAQAMHDRLESWERIKGIGGGKAGANVANCGGEGGAPGPCPESYYARSFTKRAGELSPEKGGHVGTVAQRAVELSESGDSLGASRLHAQAAEFHQRAGRKMANLGFEESAAAHAEAADAHGKAAAALHAMDEQERKAKRGSGDTAQIRTTPSPRKGS